MCCCSLAASNGVFYFTMETTRTGFVLVGLLALVALSTVGGDIPWISFCPHSCRCDARHGTLSHRVRHVTDCTNVGITDRLPANISLETQALVLRNNHMTVEHLSALERFPNLTEADLSGNQLYDLENLQFDLGTLRYVSLDRNDIDYLPNRCFLTMPDLVYLSVANNKIEMMHQDCFVGLRALKTLDLSSNRLFALDQFHALATLELLDLHDNIIPAIRDGELKRLFRLRTLNLSKNQLKHISSGAFKGLDKLQTLDLSENHLDAVPSAALRKLPKLDVLDLSANHVLRLHTNGMEGIRVSVFKMCNVRGLTIVDKGAFTDMPDLAELQLCDNRQLQYIDRDALVNVPKLRDLKVHSNNLTALEEGLLSGLPSIRSLAIHGNPFTCDCTIKWLADELVHGTRNLTIQNIEGIQCNAPSELKGVRMDDSAAQSIPSSCPPRVLELFPMDVNTVLGDKLGLDCRTVGSPVPQMEWHLPSAQKGSLLDSVELLKPGSVEAKTGHVRADGTGTLSIAYVEYTDHGDYTCRASNPNGRDERTARVHVKNVRAGLLILQITSTTVTVTWRGTHYPNEYTILYRKSNTNHTYQTADIHPYMRSYTANNLSPEKAYEFCLGIKHDKNTAKVNCTLIETLEALSTSVGVINTRSYIIGGALACFIMVFVLSCTVAYYVQRYNKRKRQEEELYSDNLSQMFLANMDSMSDTTPITYENRGAEMFDDEDLEEIRSTASMASCSTAIK